ncbi:hypothetical protein GWI33_006366 [Rhynchophorus ferrugineus]|uniref:Uncharacterized protein n=1 Tax=Rhynchophorus ferrugineus TaxID=354439 RepID=A0A834IHT1_RHYFE|nr:hypothetical protein GWI33_006366 [Rhynchophorus ferrugineus]
MIPVTDCPIFFVLPFSFVKSSPVFPRLFCGPHETNHFLRRAEVLFSIFRLSTIDMEVVGEREKMAARDSVRDGGRSGALFSRIVALRFRQERKEDYGCIYGKDVFKKARFVDDKVFVWGECVRP